MEEARWNIRLPLEIDIKIQITPTIHLSARTRDVSFEGMLIAMPLPQMRRNTPVHVHFDCDKKPVVAPAVVLRTEPDGTALMFTGENEEVADALALIMESQLDRLLVAARNGRARQP